VGVWVCGCVFVNEGVRGREEEGREGMREPRMALCVCVCVCVCTYRSTTRSNDAQTGRWSCVCV
jgi:hypothetical protein